ncbi:MAG TPA: MnmC family methyltransferase [Myxococcaceae bacterium]|nr:MnmC family methyltransferase [Myxococcaceae bacterium]
MDGLREGDFECVTLRGGDRAIRSLTHGERMHPTGPWAEANELYVRQSGLRERLAQAGPPLRLYDVGLGAAANAAAALACARELAGRGEQRRGLELVSFECDLAPLSLALRDAEGFRFLRPFTKAVEALRAHGRWEETGVTWTLELGDVLVRLKEAPRPAHLVFYDPFSPKANPALWSRTALSALRAQCDSESREGCDLFTYSAATPTRVSLLLAGFFVGAGSATGSKGETTAASTRCERLAAPLGPAWLGRWERSSSPSPHGEAMSLEMEAAVRAHPQFQSPR